MNQIPDPQLCRNEIFPSGLFRRLGPVFCIEAPSLNLHLEMRNMRALCNFVVNSEVKSRCKVPLN
jgi:hypothetical protein